MQTSKSGIGSDADDIKSCSTDDGGNTLCEAVTEFNAHSMLQCYSLHHDKAQIGGVFLSLFIKVCLVCFVNGDSVN